MTAVSPKPGTVRRSGVEVLKIFAIVCIVLSHVVWSLYPKVPNSPYTEYVLEICMATTNPQHIVLQILHSFGWVGNTIFFVCSAWFLLGSDRFSKRKWLFMLLEIWSISILIGLTVYFTRNGEVATSLLPKVFFPTTFSANWYMSAYLLFYPIHPLLNKLIAAMNKTQHLRVCVVSFFICYILNMFKRGLLFVNNLVIWFCIYLIVAYIKKYLPDFCADRKKNLRLFWASFGLFLAFYAVINFLGLRIPFLKDQMLRFAEQSNPFILICVIALFNLANRTTWTSRCVNYISGLSLLIYLIHENVLLATYYRPWMWQYAYEHYGYQHILLIVFVMGMSIFLGALVCAVLYKHTVDRLVEKASDHLYPILRGAWRSIEERLLEKSH